MHSFFIADLHLSAERPDITGAFLRFMSEEAPLCEALYVLGDLFEAWIGDDEDSPFNRQIIQAFTELTQAGVPCYFIHGNRDFLIGQRFARQSGVQLLPEHQVIDLYGEPTLIMHGDSLCTRDTEYMRFRRKARGWWWPRLMLAMPLWYRRRVAQKARRQSAEGNAIKPEEIMDVTPDEVVKVMGQTGVKRLIHGHTHRPAVHQFEIDGRPAERIVLGDWYEQGSILVAKPDSLTLTQRPLATTSEC
ncbi:UDP-2,3-diacylglucosamine diphosphatase [Saliniradius amylolyticus]|uniref:UDP-2,3-diacylglucosamine hydrolase n=1 Tax=Saliniradius amylolyticus TaxID=2183582 RepID=A0A2S2E444_9ALTE|nr:UDP-2,3-diacylglucosamine diphosphatase [Saliniradius amylolyticus]AWL12413.1 UDP-2,3-diacylglucosamine diphosphatase [Saliniradius amylolyticus]